MMPAAHRHERPGEEQLGERADAPRQHDEAVGAGDEVAQPLVEIGRVHALLDPGIHRAAPLEQLDRHPDHVPAAFVGALGARLHGAAVAAGHDVRAGARQLTAELEREPVDGIARLDGAAAEHGDQRTRGGQGGLLGRPWTIGRRPRDRERRSSAD